MRPANDDEPMPTPLHEAREPFVPLALATLAAPLLWAIHFGIVYSLEGLLCTRDMPQAAMIPAAIVVVTAAFAGVCGGLMLASGPWLRKAGAAALQSQRFLSAVQRVLAGLSLVAIAWGGSGVLFLSPCLAGY